MYGIPGGMDVGAASPRNAGNEVRQADRELEQQWLAGDPEALERAHTRYRARLESVAFRILRNRDDAEDVVQKIFIALGRASYHGKASLWTYLYRAAVNGSVNVLRSKRRRESAERELLQRELLTPTPSQPLSPESKVLEGEIMAEVARALIYVKPQHRRVLVLRVMHGLTNTEIAERENLPLATVGTWLRRGREELQRGLKPLLRDMERGTR